jgi:chlorobactene glucosyltransferase
MSMVSLHLTSVKPCYHIVMVLAFILLALSTCIELMLWFVADKRARQAIAIATVVLVAGGAGGIFGGHPTIGSGLLLIVGLYRIFNLLRVMTARLQADQLFFITRMTSGWLLGLQIVAILLVAVSFHVLITGLMILALLSVVSLLLSFHRQLRTTTPPTLLDSFADRDLPTLSVLIPARNETDDLEACLDSLVANTYPKLEILVLDDCSQVARTPEIIRGYAHDGVTFIAGKMPPEHWLAKNYAYEQLVKKANGEILLFCGVDTRFTSDSLRAIVETMVAKQKTMMSLLPENVVSPSLMSSLIQPARYGWEMLPPRRRLNRPPVLSTCWLITKDAYEAAGTMKAVTRSISPESHFARYTLAHHDGYSFLQSTKQLGLTSVKSVAEQRATAIRTRYPQLHRRPELVLILSVTELLVNVLPYGVLIGSLVARSWPLVVLSFLTCALLTVMETRLLTLAYRRYLLRSLWQLPVLAVLNVALLNYSMRQYEFSDVIWKDRNVCVPIMRVIPGLPKLN